MMRGKKPETAGSNRVYDSDILPLFDFKDAEKEQSFRLIGPVLSYDNFWVQIDTQNGLKRIPIRGIDLDPYTDEYAHDECPARAAGIRPSRVYYVNAIWRQKQDLQPAKAAKVSPAEAKLRKVMVTPSYPKGWEGYQADVKTKSWTPVVVLSLSANMVKEIIEMSDENIHKIKGKNGKATEQAFDVTDVDYGFDIKIKYFPKGSGTGKYRCLMGDVTPLEDDEMDYLVHKIDLIKLPTLSEAVANFKQLKERIVEEDNDKGKGDKKSNARSRSKLDDDDDEEKPRGKSGRSRGKSDDEDGDEDETPRGRSGGKTSRRAANDDDGDEDEAPKRGRRSARDADEDDDIPF